MVYWIKRTWGVCQRTERKVPLRDMVEDGEIRGLLVDKRDADAPHPQRRLTQIYPDLPPRRISPPLDAEHATIKVGYRGNPETGERLITPTISIVLQGAIVTVT